MFRKFFPLLILFIFSCTNKDNSMNPFLSEYETPFKIPPFESIKFSHYEPAFEIGMKEHNNEIISIAENKKYEKGKELSKHLTILLKYPLK